jgi:hypothetical protein
MAGFLGKFKKSACRYHLFWQLPLLNDFQALPHGRASDTKGAETFRFSAPSFGDSLFED